MAFFSVDNPLVFVLTLVLMAAVLKGFLSKRKFFQKHPGLLIGLILIVIVSALLYRPIVSSFGTAAGMMTGVLVFIGMVWLVMASSGTKPSETYNIVKNVGMIKFVVGITIIGIIAFSLSQIYGQDLLEDKSVSFGNAFGTSGAAVEDTSSDVDFSFLFTEHALSLIAIFLIVGILFFIVAILPK